MHPTEIDHIGIAVNDLDGAVAYYEDVVGAKVVHREVITTDLVEEVLLLVAETYIQLLHPTSPDSPVGRFLERHGEGLHHMALRVDDCASALDTFREAGAELIDQIPRPGSRNTTVAFVHPRSSYGTLIELVQENDPQRP